MNKSILLLVGAMLMGPIVAQAQDAGGYEVQDSITFPKNSSKLSGAAQDKLRTDVESLSVLLRYRPESSIEIAGYAETGEKKPGPLADARAQQVWQFLIDNGLPAERMEPVGYGAKGKPTSRVDIRISAEDAVAMNQLAQPLPTPAAPATTPPPAPAPSAEPPPIASTQPRPMPPPRAAAEPPIQIAPPPEEPAPRAPATSTYTPPVAAAPEAAPEPTPAHEENWAKKQMPASTPATRAAEQRRLKAEQAEVARQARAAEQAAAAERKKQQAAEALERRQAAEELKKQQAAEALERKQAAAELQRQQHEEARLQAKQNAEEKRKLAEQEKMRVAMSQPPPTLTPEASDNALKTSKGVKIVDNQTATTYVKPAAAPAPKSALPGEGSYFIQGTAYFAANARTLTPGSSATIDALAVRVQKLLASRPSLRVDVVGHADPLTESAQADVLAEGRAEELVKELASRGVDASRLHAAGAADSQPLTSKKGDPARNLNMRAEIRVPN